MGVKRDKEFSPELINLGTSGRHPRGGEAGHKSLEFAREVCARDQDLGVSECIAGIKAKGLNE